MYYLNNSSHQINHFYKISQIGNIYIYIFKSDKNKSGECYAMASVPGVWVLDG